jgi:hypothetical protein
MAMGKRRTPHARHNGATRCAIGPTLQSTALLKAVVATVADDDVVEHLHAGQRAGINEAAGQLDVVSAWDRIAAAMVVRQDDRRSVCRQARLEDLARLCCGRSYVGERLHPLHAVGSSPFQRNISRAPLDGIPSSLNHEERRRGRFYCRRIQTRRMKAPRVVYFPSGARTRSRSPPPHSGWWWVSLKSADCRLLVS